MSIINTFLIQFEWADLSNHQGAINPTVDNFIIGGTDEEILAALNLGQVDIHWKDESDASLLHYAACRETDVVLNKLLDLGLDVNQTSNAESGGSMALHKALLVDTISLDVVVALLVGGAEPNAVLNDSLDTPLHILTTRLSSFLSPLQKNIAFQSLIQLQQYGGDMTAVNQEGETPQTILLKYFDELDDLV